MALEIQGKLTKIMEPETGEGKNGAWSKQSFVIETFETYSKKVCITAWGDKIDQLRNFQAGQDLKVSINIESREYNERWYTDVKAWKIEPAETGAPSGFAQPSTYQPQGAPQQNAPAQPNFQAAPANAGGKDEFFGNGDDSDDLPF